MRLLPGEINSVNTALALWRTAREYLEHFTEQWVVLWLEPRVIRRNKRSLPAGKVKKCTKFVFCITAYKNTVIHLLSKYIDFSWVPLVWTDTWIHHQEENTISFLSHITSSWFILSLGCRLYTSQHFWFPYLLLNPSDIYFATTPPWLSFFFKSFPYFLLLWIIHPTNFRSCRFSTSVPLSAFTPPEPWATESLLVPHTMVFQQRVNRGCS